MMVDKVFYHSQVKNSGINNQNGNNGNVINAKGNDSPINQLKQEKL